MCLNSHPAYLYHLSDSLSGAKEEMFFENRIWRKFIAFKET